MLENVHWNWSKLLSVRGNPVAWVWFLRRITTRPTAWRGADVSVAAVSSLRLQAAAVITDVSSEAAALHDATLTHSMWAGGAAVGFPGSGKRNRTKSGLQSAVSLTQSTMFYELVYLGVQLLFPLLVYFHCNFWTINSSLNVFDISIRGIGAWDHLVLTWGRKPWTAAL